MTTRWMAAAFILMLGLGTTRANAAYSRIVAFGDSLTDTGNVFAAQGGAYPVSPPYAAGRFSDGPVWVETLAAGLGLASPTPSLIGGSNYAFAGAETSLSGLSSEGTPNIGVQVGMYLATQPTITANQLFVIWGGANDLLHQPVPNPAQSVANLVAEITTLARAGAQQFLVPNLPALGATPAVRALGPGAVAAENFLSLRFNAELAASLNKLGSTLGISIHQLDIDGLFQGMLSNPGQYGLSNVTDQAKAGETGLPGTVVANPNSYLFWDPVHPTATVHRAIGEAAIGVLAVPEPSSVILVGLGIAGCSVVAARRRRWGTSPRFRVGVRRGIAKGE